MKGSTGIRTFKLIKIKIPNMSVCRVLKKIGMGKLHKIMWWKVIREKSLIETTRVLVIIGLKLK